MIAGAPTAGPWGVQLRRERLNRSVLIDCSGRRRYTFVRATVIFPNCGKRDALGTS